MINLLNLQKLLSAIDPDLVVAGIKIPAFLPRQHVIRDSYFSGILNQSNFQSR
jgi:hypothetical protein